MRIFYGLAIVWLVDVLSRVSAETSTIRVKTTFPDDLFPQDVPSNSTSTGIIQPRQNYDGVTGFITKSGDIFELANSDEMELIESRQEPDQDAGVTMCRYGSIVVYSDVDCNSFFQPGSSVINRNRISQSNLDQEEEHPLKRKKKKSNKNRRRKPSKKKLKNKKRNKNKQKNKQKNKRRKALKRRGTQNRRRNTFNQNRRKYPQRTKNPKHQRRGNKNDFKQNRIDSNAETRSHLNPLQFAILYN